MDMNEYTLEFLMRCRVAERRAQAERANLIRVPGPCPADSRWCWGMR